MLHGTKTVIKHKIGLLNLAEELGNVSKACRIMGLSRDTFYRYQNAVEQGGVEALIDRSRRKPNLKNRVDEQTEAAVVAYAIEQPAHGQVRASNELRKRGVFISPSGVRCVWLRNDLSCFKDRLKALEEKSAKENFILTESQVQALERKKHDDVVAGEIETAHPGYLGSQDTYAKVGFAKLYTTKTPITSADLLNDKVLPFYEQHQLPLLRILTDRGTEYCGKRETHDYQLYLAINDIDHT
jgi:molybdenum-dependent DNA-binding transcriptional regulator ModE